MLIQWLQVCNIEGEWGIWIAQCFLRWGAYCLEERGWFLASVCLQEEGAFGREGEASCKFQSQGFRANREVSEEVSALGSLLTKNYWRKNTEGSQILEQDERKLRRVWKEKGKGRWEAQHPSRVGGKGLGLALPHELGHSPDLASLGY